MRHLQAQGAGGSWRAGVVVPVALLMMLVARPVTAQVPPLACGTVLTQDTTLTADLTGCPGSALVVGADGITVDLGGFTLDGQLSPPLLESGLTGVDNSGGYDDVVVRNGTVRDFVVAVQVTGADRNLVTGLVVTANDAGIRLLGGDANRVEDNEVTSNGIGAAEFGVGISLQGVDGAVSEGNVIARNRTRSNRYRGIEVVSGTVVGTLIEGNTQISDGATGQPGDGALVVSWGPGDIRGTVVRGNSWTESGGATITGEQSTGTLLEGNISGRERVSEGRSRGFQDYGQDTTIRFNEIVNSGTGVDIESESRGATVVGNRFQDNTPAIFVAGDDARIEANLIEGDDSSNFGIIVFTDATATEVRANVVNDIGEGIWIRGTDVVVEANYVVDNDYEGIHVFEEAVNTRVTANYALRNRIGIQVEGSDAVLTSNVANANRELGIDAPDQPTDGGGNSARRNGDPRQCVGVRCRR